jgi:hypothetical protein
VLAAQCCWTATCAATFLQADVQLALPRLQSLSWVWDECRHDEMGPMSRALQAASQLLSLTALAITNVQRCTVTCARRMATSTMKTTTKAASACPCVWCVLHMKLALDMSLDFRDAAANIAQNMFRCTGASSVPQPRLLHTIFVFLRRCTAASLPNLKALSIAGEIAARMQRRLADTTWTEELNVERNLQFDKWGVMAGVLRTVTSHLGMQKLKLTHFSITNTDPYRTPPADDLFTRVPAIAVSGKGVPHALDWSLTAFRLTSLTLAGIALGDLQLQKQARIAGTISTPTAHTLAIGVTSR